MNRLLKSLVAALVLSVWITLPSCEPKINPDTYLQREVKEVQQRIEPPNSHLLRQPWVSRQNWGASAIWEFESNDSAAAYKGWVTNRLRPDFQARDTANSGLRFSKDVQGDLETLSIETASPAGTLHVTVKLELYPD